VSGDIFDKFRVKDNLPPLCTSRNTHPKLVLTSILCRIKETEKCVITKLQKLN